MFVDLHNWHCMLPNDVVVCVRQHGRRSYPPTRLPDMMYVPAAPGRLRSNAPLSVMRACANAFVYTLQHYDTRPGAVHLDSPVGLRTRYRRRPEVTCEGTEELCIHLHDRDNDTRRVHVDMRNYAGVAGDYGPTMEDLACAWIAARPAQFGEMLISAGVCPHDIDWMARGRVKERWRKYYNRHIGTRRLISLDTTLPQWRVCGLKDGEKLTLALRLTASGELHNVELVGGRETEIEPGLASIFYEFLLYCASQLRLRSYRPSIRLSQQSLSSGFDGARLVHGTIADKVSSSYTNWMVVSDQYARMSDDALMASLWLCTEKMQELPSPHFVHWLTQQGVPARYASKLLSPSDRLVLGELQKRVEDSTEPPRHPAS